MNQLAARIAGFPAALRAAGLPVGLDAGPLYLRALDAIPEIGTDDLFWVGRILLASRADDLVVHDRVFHEWFLGAGAAKVALAREPDRQRLEGAPGSGLVAAERRRGAIDSKSAQASPIEMIRQRNPLLIAQDAGSQERALLACFHRYAPRVRTRRRVPKPRGTDLDLRGTLRASLRQGGEIMTIPRLVRLERKRPVVLLIDVSRSMHGTSDDFMRAAALLVRADPGVEAFALGTRLTSVTQRLRRGEFSVALSATSRAVVDWDSGTRLGETVAALLADKRNTARLAGATIILMTDGLERGDPTQLIAGVKRLSRLSHRLILATPLAVDPRYRAATRALLGMLPALDRVVGCASFDDITTMLGHLTIVDRNARGTILHQETAP
jgi:uncharacterized protein